MLEFSKLVRIFLFDLKNGPIFFPIISPKFEAFLYPIILK